METDAETARLTAELQRETEAAVVKAVREAVEGWEERLKRPEGERSVAAGRTQVG